MNLKLIVISLAVAIAVMLGVAAPAHAIHPQQGKTRSPKSSLTLARVKKQGPLCGMRVSIVGETEEARSQPAVLLLKRMDGLKEHLPLTVWNRRLMSAVQSERIGGDTMSYFLGKMGVLFGEDGRLKKDLNNRLLARWDAIPQGELEAWSKSFEAATSDRAFQDKLIEGGGIIYSIRFADPQDLVRLEIKLTLIVVDALFKEDRYDSVKAAQYRSRLKQLTYGDVSNCISVLPAFRNAEVDCAVSLMLVDELFAKGRFDRARFRSALTAGASNI